MRTLCRSSFLVLLALAAGCQRVNYEKTDSLKGFEFRSADLSAPRYTQKILIQVAPTSQPVCTYLIRSSDLAALEEVLNARKIPPASKLIASRESRDQAEAYSFEGTVPAGTEYSIVLYNAGTKPTDVKLKVTGR